MLSQFLNGGVSLTTKEKYNIAKYLYKHGDTQVSHLPKKLLKIPQISMCQYFMLKHTSDPRDPILHMESRHIDNFVAARKEKTNEFRNWIQPIVSVIALICSIAALIISLVK